MTDIAGDLRLKLEQLVDHYVTAGSETPERDMRRAYNEDPDPAMSQARSTSRRTTGQQQPDQHYPDMRFEHGCLVASLIFEAGPDEVHNLQRSDASSSREASSFR